MFFSRTELKMQTMNKKKECMSSCHGIFFFHFTCSVILFDIVMDKVQLDSLPIWDIKHALLVRGSE